MKHNLFPHLRHGDSHYLAGERDGNALRGLEVLEFLVKYRGDAPSSRDVVVLHLVVRLLHWCSLQAEFDLVHEPLLKIGHFVLLEKGKTSV